MAGKATPTARVPANSGGPSAGVSADPPESIPIVQKLLDHIEVLNKTVDTFSDLMQSAVSKLMELDQIVQEVEEQRDSLKQALESKEEVENELYMMIAKLEEVNKKQEAEHAAALRASWKKGRAQGRKEMKEEINAHLSKIGA